MLDDGSFRAGIVEYQLFIGGTLEKSETGGIVGLLVVQGEDTVSYGCRAI